MLEYKPDNKTKTKQIIINPFHLQIAKPLQLVSFSHTMQIPFQQTVCLAESIKEKRY